MCDWKATYPKTKSYRTRLIRQLVEPHPFAFACQASQSTPFVPFWKGHQLAIDIKLLFDMRLHLMAVNWNLSIWCAQTSFWESIKFLFYHSPLEGPWTCAFTSPSGLGLAPCAGSLQQWDNAVSWGWGWGGFHASDGAFMAQRWYWGIVNGWDSDVAVISASVCKQQLEWKFLQCCRVWSLQEKFCSAQGWLVGRLPSLVRNPWDDCCPSPGKFVRVSMIW